MIIIPIQLDKGMDLKFNIVKILFEYFRKLRDY
jgi:hypothetical protein